MSWRDFDDNYLINTDKYNFVLEKLENVVNKETKEVTQKYKNPQFFGRFETLLEYCLYDRIKDSKSETIEELINEIKEYKKHVTDLVKRENINLKDFQNESV